VKIGFLYNQGDKGSWMNYFIGIDDTDTIESRGTGHLARMIAHAFSSDFEIKGVTRHQLLQDESIPMTAKNSCAAILLSGQRYPLDEIALYARKIILDDFQPGSDPGLCVAVNDVPSDITHFGRIAQEQVVDQDQARILAVDNHLHLEGLGGNQDGVIGALAAVGLAASGNDGRYVMVGSIRELEGVLPVSAVLEAGVSAVKWIDGELITEGLVITDKLRPARRQANPVLYVEAGEEYWRPLKLD
jgi:hypothetical protein